MEWEAKIIEHKGEKRIGVYFENIPDLNARIRKIEGAKWSQSKRVWHVPCNDENKKKFMDIDKLIGNENTLSINLKFDNKAQEINSKSNLQMTNSINTQVCIQVSSKKIIIKLPKNDLDTQFIASIRYSRWDKKQYCWIVPNYKNNLDLLKNYFKERISELIINEDPVLDTSARLTAQRGELIIIKTKNGRLKLIFEYDKLLTKTIKSLPYHAWNNENKWWTIPYAERFYNEITTIAISLNYKITYSEEETDDIKKSRTSVYDIDKYKTCPEAYILKLKELRYSENTIKTYKVLFEEFINYYNHIETDEIDESLITAFLRYMVIERKVSISYQNQAINAVKFYYERVLGGQRKVYLIDRPREEKKLPNVLNIKEVTDLLKATENLKHKAILMLAYSGGLRVSELINVKIKDIDSSRMQIRIEQAKGKKDRYTLLSLKLLELLRKYFTEYKPKVYLFEGQNGGQYATRSIQSIMKDSVKKAGIQKQVSVHTLRHTFATHLLENGTDLRYIQALLGHESSKTTEIYTHITTKGFDQIINPMDKLDI